MAILPKQNGGRTPPYLPFSRFQQSLDALAIALPPRIDRSTWASESEYTATLLLNAYDFLRLTDSERTPTDLLRRLAGDAENRPAILQQSLSAGYGEVLQVVATAESPADLDEALAPFRTSGATHRKAVSFLLNACAWARLPVSPALTGKRRASHVKTSPAAETTIEATTVSVALRSGGTLTLSGRLNPFALSSDDRQFVFRLVDQLRAYQESSRPEEPDSAEEEEAPF